MGTTAVLSRNAAVEGRCQALETKTPLDLDAVDRRASQRAYAMISLTYHTVGAMNEKLAMTAYHAMAAVAAELGEQELADTLFTPMRRDESLHLGYYRTYARELAGQVQPWQRRAVRKLVVQTYQPFVARAMALCVASARLELEVEGMAEPEPVGARAW